MTFPPERRRFRRLRKGASIKYIRTEGEGGSKKPENMRMILTDRLREKRTRGGEGVKKAGKSAYAHCLTQGT